MCTTREKTRVAPNDRLLEGPSLVHLQQGKHKQSPRADPEIPDEVKPNRSDEDVKKYIPWRVADHFSAYMEARKLKTQAPRVWMS